MSARPGVVPAVSGLGMLQNTDHACATSPFWGLTLSLAEIAERVERRRAAEHATTPPQRSALGKEDAAGDEPAAREEAA